MEFLNMWYVDEDEVERIWEQFNNVVEKISVQEKVNSFAAKMKAMFPVLQIASIEGGGEINISKNLSITQREVNEVQQKILTIIKKIGGEAKPLKYELKKDIGCRLIYVNGYFGINKIYFKGKPEKNIVNKITHVKNAKDLVWEFEYLEDYDLPIGFANKRHDIMVMNYSNIRENITNYDSVKVDMYADGKKINTHVRHLTQSIESMRPFYFKIIGWINWDGENDFYIKPVVIMR